MRLWALTVGTILLCAAAGHAQDSTASAQPSGGGVRLAPEIDELPTLDSVQVWYYSKGKVGEPESIKLISSQGGAVRLP